MKNILLITFSVFVLSAQADLITAEYTYNWNSTLSAEYSKNACKNAIVVANAENKKAKKARFEWRDTRKLLKKAKKVGGKRCVELANKAKNQAILAQQQAKDQANAGPHF